MDMVCLRNIFIYTLHEGDKVDDEDDDDDNINNNNNNIKRHDRVSAQLHFNICKETGVKIKKKN
jgi:hypothetical protein